MHSQGYGLQSLAEFQSTAVSTCLAPSLLSSLYGFLPEFDNSSRHLTVRFTPLRSCLFQAPCCEQPVSILSLDQALKLCSCHPAHLLMLGFHPSHTIATFMTFLPFRFYLNCPGLFPLFQSFYSPRVLLQLKLALSRPSSFPIWNFCLLISTSFFDFLNSWGYFFPSAQFFLSPRLFFRFSFHWKSTGVRKFKSRGDQFVFQRSNHLTWWRYYINKLLNCQQ